MRDLDLSNDSVPLSLGYGTHTNGPYWLLELQPSKALQADSKRKNIKESMLSTQHFFPLTE